MTKEPFIAHSELTNEIYIVIGKEKYRVTEQAIKAVKAIRSLEQEPTKNDLAVDCISRKAALDITWQDPSYSDPLNVLTEVRDKIRELPSVTPQVRKGQWIECIPGGAEEWCYKCSECNFWKYKKTINLSKFKFCPNCGSRNEVKE